MSDAPLLGREAEVAAVDAAVARALAGRGTLVLVTGEPGIGKTRIVRELEAIALGNGFRCAWGRAWEAGGAPAFWPWLQICRALGVPWDETAGQSSGASDRTETGEGGRDARFTRFDRLTEALAAVSREQPLALLFDDVHAADEASLQLLLFASRRLASERVVIAAAARDADIAEREPFGALALDALCLAPKRLSRSEVMAWIGDAETAAGIYEKSEGLPLFVDEVLRVGATAVGRAHRLHAVLDAHVSRLSSETLAVVERAAVVGRRFSLDDVAFDPGERAAVAPALRAATLAGVLLDEGERHYAFAHVLLRDRLYERIDPARRESMHATVGALLQARGEHAQAFHHLALANLVNERERIATVGLRAARAEFDDLAFEGAASRCDAALGFAPSPSPLAFELTLLSARARFAAGAVAPAREAAARAHDLACSLRDPDGAALAALTYGTEAFTAQIDPRLVRMLETALELGPSSEFVPQVSARLAAALTPPTSHAEAERVIARAWEAVAAAREVADRTVLLETLRHAAPALGYMVAESVRTSLVDEIFDVALALDRHDVVAEVAGVAFTFRTVSGRTDGGAALTALERAVSQLGRHQCWRLHAAQATRALLAGRLDEASEHGDAIETLATQFPITSAEVALLALRVSVALFSGDPASIGETLDPDAMDRPPASFFRGVVLAAIGRRDEARAQIRAILAAPSGFPQVAVAGEACVLCQDAELAALVRPRLAEYVGSTEYFAGPGGVFFLGPTTLTVAELDRLCGDEPRALAGYRRALELCEQAGLAPRAQAVRARLARPVAASVAVESARDVFELRRDGELWTLKWNGRALAHLPDVKGMAYLETLLDHPGRDFHVLELVGAEHRPGDSGAVLDERAVRDYRRRVQELRTELDEFEAAGDAGRAARARSELEQLEDELERAFGLGDRPRIAGSELERARINVQRRIKDALDRVTRVDPDAAKRLRRDLRTGISCSYRP